MLAFNGIVNSVKGLWAAIGGLPGFILTALTMGVITLVSRYQDLTQKIKQTQDEIFDRRKQVAKELGLDALVEAHDEYEVDRALNLGAEIVGVNNRDLRTFQVDMNNSIRLRKMAPDNVVFVSESSFPFPTNAPHRATWGLLFWLVSYTIFCFHLCAECAGNFVDFPFGLW